MIMMGMMGMGMIRRGFGCMLLVGGREIGRE